MSGLNILVVGASIAGPATAYWLAKAGAKVTVIERFSELRTGGQAIDIRTGGVSVMRKMPGMEVQVRQRSTQEEGVAFVRDDGRPYGIIRATGNPDQQSLISEYEILRGDLSRILVDLTKDNERVNYIFGEQILSMQQSGGHDVPIKVQFANGLPSTHYDLVVACDGSTSRTRAMTFECGVRDHIVPTNSWAAYFSIKRDVFPRSQISYGCSAVGGRFISVSSDPLGFSRVLLTSVPRNGRDEVLGLFRQTSSPEPQRLKQAIARRYTGVGWITDSLMSEMMDSSDFYASEIVQVKVPSLSKGRVVLLGGAGYAAGPTGGGTSLALTGAYILGGEVGKHAGDISRALTEYDERMRPIIKEYHTIPPLVSTILAPHTAWGIWLRNHLFALIAWTGIAEVLQRFLGAAFADTKNFPLPEYDWNM